MTGDVDWFSFSAIGGRQYRFETELVTLVDSVLRVIGTNGMTELAMDDNSGPGNASLINWTAPSSGTYYVEARGFNNNTGTYNVSLSLIDDHGNNAAGASAIAVPSTRAGTVEVASDVDWFSFSAVAGVIYQVATTLGSLDDTFLRLIDTNGTTQLAFDDDAGPGFASLIAWTAPSSGTYYVEASGFGGGIGSYTVSLSAVDDHGNNAAGATASTDPSTNAGLIETGVDVDWFSFAAVGGVAYQISTTLGTLIDSVLRVIGTNGTTELAEDDDSGPGDASLINWTAPANGTYYVEARGFGGTTGSYNVLIEGNDDHGDNAANDTAVAVGSTTAGVSERAGDLDWFSFVAVEAADYRIATTLGSLPDSVLRLIGANGTTELAMDDDSGPGNASLINWTAPASGTYYIEARGFNNNTGAYSLSLTAVDDHGNNAAGATPAPSPSVRAGVIEVSGDVDWFSFSAVGGVAYQFATTLGGLEDTVLRLIGTNGTTQLATNDDGGPGLASLISWTAPASGTYFVEVRGFSSNVGDYEVSVSSVVVPSLLGDYNRDAKVDAADYVVYRKTLGTSGLPAYSGADGDGNGTIGQGDLAVWKATLWADAWRGKRRTSGEGGRRRGEYRAGSWDRGASIRR